MKKATIFVTFMAILGPLWTACTHSLSEQSTPTQALVDEGNAKLKEADQVRGRLLSRHRIALIGSTPIHWRKLSRLQRREVQGELAHYLTLVNRVLQIDAASHITIEMRDQVFALRDGAENLQKSVEKFERVFGENFNPQRDERMSAQPAIKRQAGIEI